MLKTFDYNKMPIVEAVNEIMVDAAKRGASDIHFDPLENIMKIRIRIDGTLIDYALVPNDIKKNLITRIKIIAGMNITESRLPQDGAIKATVQGTSLDLRVSTIPTNMGEKIVIRILDYSLSGAGIENLGFSDKNYKKVIEMINQPNGIILVTGATGTGKSTTVYAVLQRLNKESTNIITVEDPVEMNIEGVNQIQANSEIGLDFATALRSILRQDPNIIMIGEIRDTETAKIAIRASITGHLVLSTLHTNDSLNTIERLLDMDVERYLLASSLSGIISQRLARRLCPHCRIERKPNKYEEKLFEASLGHSVDKLYSANKSGCEHCHGGFSGRIAIQEVLLINQQIRDAISANKSKEELRDLVYNNDVDSLLQDGLAKVEQGITSMEELLKLIELENEDATIARMGLEAATNLGDELEEQIIEDEIKATPANNIEIDENILNNHDIINETNNIEEEVKEDVSPIAIDDSINDLLDDITDNKEEIDSSLNEEESDKGNKFFGKKKKHKKDKKKNDEEVQEELPEKNNIQDNNISDLSLDKLDNFDFNDIKFDNNINNDLSLDNNINFDDINLNNSDLKLDDLNLDNNNLKLDDLNLDNNELKLDELNLDNNDLKLDELNLDNNDLKFDELNLNNDNNLNFDNLNLDELKLDNNNDLSFDDVKLDDNNQITNNNDIKFENTFDNTTNFDINNLNLDEAKETDSSNEVNDIKFDTLEDGKLDDDLSGASDDDIMNLFN